MIRADPMPLHFDDAMTTLHWATDLQEFRFRDPSDPMREIQHFAESLRSIASRMPGEPPEMPAPMVDPLGFICAARAYLSMVVLGPIASSAPRGETIH
jgi:hypothetical protein